MAITKGQLISDCLKLMFDNEEQINPDNVSNNGDYTLRTINIIESINRGLYVANELNKLPKKVFYITFDTEAVEKNHYHSKYNLNDLLSSEDESLYKIHRISYLQINGKVTTKIDIRYEGELLVLTSLSDPNDYLSESYPERIEEKYIIEYLPMIKELTYLDSDSKVIPYPDNIVRKLPYYVAGELLVEENPNMAMAYKDMYEGFLLRLPSEQDIQKPNIVNHYSNLFK